MLSSFTLIASMFKALVAPTKFVPRSDLKIGSAPNSNVHFHSGNKGTR